MAILRELKQCTDVWGITCLRYEILKFLLNFSIDPPEVIKQSMMKEAVAEREKRRQILISEAKRESEINIAMGFKSLIIQKAEGEVIAYNRNKAPC